MKDIKSMMIGFLLATCMFLMLGADSKDSQIGKYQGFGSEGTKLLNTTNGELWEYSAWSPKRWIYVTNQFAQE